MANSDHEKKMVYLAYRDIFKNELAKIRKRRKVRNIVEKHQDDLHQKQVTSSIGSEKTCTILEQLLAARLFESDSAAKAFFPTLFSSEELGNDTALIVKSVEDGVESKPGQEDGKPHGANSFPYILLSPDTPMPNGTPSEADPAVGQHAFDIGSVEPIFQVRENETSSNEVVHEDEEKSKNPLKRKRDFDTIPPNPTYLPSKLQHLILSQTQQLLEECCFHFAEKWFPSMLKENRFDAPEAIELTKWCKTLLKCNIPAEATTLGPGQSLAFLLKRAISLRHCAVHRRPQIPVKKMEEMIRDAWLLCQALQDDLRAPQLLQWHKELQNVVTHLQSITSAQREAVQAELEDIRTARAELEGRLAELKAKENELTKSLRAEGRTHQPIDSEKLRSLEEVFGAPDLASHNSTLKEIEGL